MKQILIAIINYKCEQEVLDFALNLSKQTVVDNIFLAVVNNMASTDSKINLEKELQSIKIDSKVYLPNENLGYLNGALFAYEMFKKENNYLPNWLVVSNTDIVIENELFFNYFLSTNYDEDIWCVAPSVLSGDRKRYCNPHYKQRIPLKKVNRVIKIFNNNILANAYMGVCKFKEYHKEQKKQESQYVYSSHGCFFILRKEFFEYLDGEKYGVFLYSEESFIAEMILQANKKEFYDSNIELIHNENLSTGKINKNKKYKMMSSSMKYIKEKFYL